MLKEIRCDAFKLGNKSIRPPIVFHNGLNVVNGGDIVDNSIGKSTVLQIVDFAFGGEYYPKTEAVKHLGNHKICFCFEFAEESFYFARNVKPDSIVYKCDSNYTELSQISIEIFRQWLLEKYAMTELGGTFRNLITCFQRFSGRMADYKSHILDSYPGESLSASIPRIEMLFNDFSSLKQLRFEEKQAKDKLNAIKDGRRFGIYDSEIDKDSLEEKQRELQDKKDELEMLKGNLGSIPDNSDFTIDEKALIFRNKISVARRRKTRNLERLDFINHNLNGETFLPASTIRRLTEFFPDAQIEKIEEIESFHTKISEIMKIEFEQEKTMLEQNLTSIDDEIKTLENTMEELGISKTIPPTTIEEVLDLQNEIKNLEAKIEAFKTMISAKELAKIASETRKDSEKDILDGIEDKLNKEIENICARVFGNNTKSPVVSLSAEHSYEYKIDGDDGDGVSLLCTLIFDLAVLKLTKLPIIIHDTRLAKEVNKNCHGNIIKIYKDFMDKQIFIAFDEVSQYKEDVQKIIQDNSVIQLDSDNPLFGEKWNKKE